MQELIKFLREEFPALLVRAMREIYRSAHAYDAGSQVSLDTSSRLVLERNDDRLFATLVNESNVNIWLSLGKAAQANRGIQLRPLGGAMTFGIATDIPWTGSIYAIAETGTGNILDVTEVHLT